MSLVIKPPLNGFSRNIYIIYNFKQVYDQILIVLYSDVMNNWQKVPVDYKDSSWNTDLLAAYTDDDTFSYISEKLNIIFEQHKLLFNINNSIHPILLADHVALIFNYCS